MYTHSFDPIATIEYNDSFKWYLYRNPKVAEGFTTSVNLAILAICKNPYLYKNVHGAIREISVGKYPYNVVYKIYEQAKHIAIISVYHQSRNPIKKYKKY